MVRTGFLALAALSLLTSCARDNPDNIPLHGQWEHTSRLDSITVDGRAFAGSELMGAMGEFNKIETRCGEPLYTEPGWQADDIADKTGGKCTLDNYEHSAGGATFSGTCQLAGLGVNFAPTMEGRSFFDETSSRDVVTMEGSVKIPASSRPHYLKIIVVQEGKRIGDC